MSEFIEIRWVSGSLDEARKISRYLVQERLVASASIIPWVESITMWNNQLETTQETHIVFVTRHAFLEKVVRVLEENTSYEIPDVTYINIESGNTPYTEWLNESIRDYSNIPNKN